MMPPKSGLKSSILIKLQADHKMLPYFCLEKQWPLYRSSAKEGGKSGLQWVPHPVKSGGFMWVTA